MPGLRKDAFAEESAEVEVLFANLDKMKSLTRKIQASMGRLETSGRTVQDAIGPVYGNTQKLQTTNHNIDMIINAIDRIREPLDMRNREERIIRNKPQRVGLQDYMASIDRTRQALREMKQTNLRSNQQAIQELNTLLKAGIGELEEVFRDVLRDGQQPIEPLHFITKGVEFPRLPGNKTSQLQTINEYVSASNSEMSSGQRNMPPTAKIYADIRGQYMTYSLQNLATASIGTARKQHSDSLYKRGDCAIGTYAQGITGIYSAEFNSIRDVFQSDECHQVFHLTCQNSLNAFAATLKDLDKHIKDNLLADCYLAYEIIEVVSISSLEIENRTRAGEVKQAMADACKPLRETAKTSLNIFLSDIRNRAREMAALPQDAAAVSLSTEAMTRLQLLTEYLAPVTSILTSLGDGGWSSPNLSNSLANSPSLRSFDVGPDGNMLFAHYASDMVETLMSNLQMRAHAAYKSKSQQGVFLLNNVVIVERAIRSSELQTLLDSAQPKIEAWRKKAVAMYLDVWKETSAYLLDVQYTNRGQRPPSTGQAIDSAAVVKSLSSKDKDAIKEKFRNFNTSFDDNIAKHRSYKMEKEARALLAREVQMFIEALYGRFWDRYHDIDKGKGKYVKYDKNQLNAWLSNLA
ncbi:Cullin repeat-like-containing domain protein [Elsinoe ampelina]|uniref:Exocyst complex protein EXO70 n=1 Tax=Elsinoe ampelina TaxID=302913 RepID=A0A6A6GRE6_9PEZI|nr:Cullin repeat-like-containing domain protein [Elsinoe ampelina]